MQEFCDVITTMTHININSNTPPLRHSFAQSFSRAVHRSSENCQLQEVFLTENDFDDEAVVLIVKALLVVPSIRVLVLNGNRITDRSGISTLLLSHFLFSFSFLLFFF